MTSDYSVHLPYLQRIKMELSLVARKHSHNYRNNDPRFAGDFFGLLLLHEIFLGSVELPADDHGFSSGALDLDFETGERATANE